MALIYRIQNEYGEGMYTGPSCDASSSMHEHRHPLPSDDAALKDKWINLKNATHYKFGFSSIEQLKFWIYKLKWRKELAKAGYCVYIFETDDFLIGDTQAVFVKDTATLVETISLTKI